MKGFWQRFGVIAALALLVRLVSLPLYPLMDTTEARYGNMARIMAETGNWLTPMFDYGVPFWGKPPLHTWASAAGIELFGVNELAVRLPHFLAALLTLALMAWFARKLAVSASATVMVLSTTVVFSIAAGAVMTDMLLTLGLTLAMVGFYCGWHGSKGWSYAGFAGLAIGLLAKGPLVIVLMGLALLPWLVWQHGLFRGVQQLWQRLPLLSGLGLMLLLTAPWYWLAEQATPGFLQYFLVGEHFLRFVDSGWQGDLYGSAHDQTRGTIWIYFMLAALPWSPLLLWLGWRHRRGTMSDWQALALCWMLAPMLLFTLAGNILPAYVLPGIPAMALLIAAALTPARQRWFGKVALTTPLLLVIAIAVLWLQTAEERSDKALLSHRSAELVDVTPLYYFDEVTFSGQFYSAGKAQLLPTEPRALAALPAKPFYLVGRNRQLDRLPRSLTDNCSTVKIGSRRSLLLCGEVATP
ncbi:ArnT family glycosyltransferase [Ferrimonas senticii]|uniref:ArnT family glycosyltransferase n=1 Tax=Ferrimonas senticii TaxID=394566 RepID=UPI0004163716|nr:glycosyltransferase family 39 protein [Ferrimonas senticii]